MYFMTNPCGLFFYCLSYNIMCQSIYLQWYVFIDWDLIKQLTKIVITLNCHSIVSHFHLHILVWFSNVLYVFPLSIFVHRTHFFIEAFLRYKFSKLYFWIFGVVPTFWSISRVLIDQFWHASTQTKDNWTFYNFLFI